MRCFMGRSREKQGIKIWFLWDTRDSDKIKKYWVRQLVHASLPQDSTLFIVQYISGQALRVGGNDDDTECDC